MNTRQRAALASYLYYEWLHESTTRDECRRPVLPSVERRADALVAIRQDLRLQPVAVAAQRRLF